MQYRSEQSLRVTGFKLSKRLQGLNDVFLIMLIWFWQKHQLRISPAPTKEERTL